MERVQTLDARVGGGDNQKRGRDREDGKRGHSRPKGQILEACLQGLPAFSWPALPNFLEGRVIIMLEEKLVLISVF